MGNVQVGDGDYAEILLLLVLQHLGKVGKLLRVNRERAVVLLVINVQVNCVAGNFIRT